MGVEKAKMVVGKHVKTGARTKIKQEGGGDKGRKGRKKGDYRQPIIKKFAHPYSPNLSPSPSYFFLSSPQFLRALP